MASTTPTALVSRPPLFGSPRRPRSAGVRRLLAVTLAAACLVGAARNAAADPWEHRVGDWRGRPSSEAVAWIRRVSPTHPLSLAFDWRPEQREGVVVAQDPAAGELTPGQRIRLVVNQAPLSLRTARVPEVVGQTRSRAIRMIAEAGLSHRVSGSGLTDDTDRVQVVVRQFPAGHSPVRPGTSVAIDLEWRERVGGRTGEEHRTPDVVGMREADAVGRLRRAGLVPVVDGLQGEGRKVVASQSPAAGAAARVGSRVRLALHFEHPAPVEVIVVRTIVPRVVGLDRATAEAALRAAGLRPLFVAGTHAVRTHVVSQTPAPGALVARGSEVRLVLGRAPVK